MIGESPGDRPRDSKQIRSDVTVSGKTSVESGDTKSKAESKKAEPAKGAEKSPVTSSEKKPATK